MGYEGSLCEITTFIVYLVSEGIESRLPGAVLSS